MANEFRRGDAVEWNYRGRMVRGKVQKRLVERTEIEGQVFAASKEDPRYVVKSEKTGKVTARRPGTLKKAS